MDLMLRVDWRDRDIGVDLIPHLWLELDGEFIGLRHEVYVPRFRKSYPCMCDVTVRGRRVEFDYTSKKWRRFNADSDIEIGVMLLEFADSKRKVLKDIPVVSWRDEKDRSYTKYPEVPVTLEPAIDAGDPDFLVSGIEGLERLARHLVRERKPALARKKKELARIQRGSLACEVCDFDFTVAYGDAGIDFCEVHHREPIASKRGARTTSMDHLAILCSNCHRMIHRTDPIVPVEVFREGHLEGIRGAWEKLLRVGPGKSPA